jgi:TIR domain
MSGGPVRVFYSYSHADARMLERLRKHLAILRRHGLISEWHDRDIEAGAEWRDEIARELDEADLILLLVSADFLASDFCYEEEMVRAIARADRAEATVIGVMLRPVDGWNLTPFARFQIVPRNARPITQWASADEAYSDVAASIRSVIEQRLRGRSEEPPVLHPDLPSAAPLPADPAAPARCQQIEAALAQLLDRGHPDEFIVVVGDGEANYYTQCFAEEGSLWCEAVANDYLDAAHALSADATARLSALGWNPPGDSVPNWWCVRPTPQSVATLMVRTLGEAYGVRLDQPFRIERSWAS